MPTDEKFINLFWEQKIELFEGINRLPDRKILQRSFILLTRKAEIEGTPVEQFVSKALKQTMRRTLRRDNLSEDLINEQIKKQGEKIKINKLEEIIKTMKEI